MDEYEPKHRGEPKPEYKKCVTGCGRRAEVLGDSNGKDPMLCLSCYYRL